MNDIAQAIEYLKERKANQITEYKIKSYDLAIQALQEKADRENPKPLTLEQLEEHICKPVYIVDHYNVIDSWFIVGNNDWYADGYEDSEAKQLYGITWWAYDHEPKEVTDDR